MVRSVSLLPLAAGLLSIFLGALALSGNRPLSASARYFLGLNVSTGLWSLTYFLVLNLPAGPDPLVSPIGTWPHTLLVLQAVGVAGAPTYWFLFCASYSRKTSWTTGWPKVLAYAPIAYTLAVTATNPLHRLFADQVAPGAPVTYGPLAPLHQAMTFALVGLGIWLLFTSARKRGSALSKRQALVLGVAACVPTLGGLAWSLRHQLDLPLTVNLTPVLFPILNLVLAYELLRPGLADIVPRAALHAFDAISDAAIALDMDNRVVALNRTARRLFPDARAAVALGDVDEDLASAAETCLHSATGYTGFDLEAEGLLYWTRVRKMTDRRGVPMGCVILMTDVTELRATQAKIVELRRALDYEIEFPQLPMPDIDRRRQG